MALRRVDREGRLVLPVTRMSQGVSSVSKRPSSVRFSSTIFVADVNLVEGRDGGPAAISRDASRAS